MKLFGNVNIFGADEVTRARKLLSGGTLAEYSIEDTLLNKIPISVSEKLDFAGVFGKKRKQWARKIIFQFILVAFVLFASGFTPGLLVTLLLFVFNYLSLKIQSKRRILSFDKDYPAFLLSLRSAIRTGHDPLTALTRSGALFEEDSVVKREIAKISQGLEEGMTEEEALREFASTINHPDVPLFRVGFLLAREHGASLAPCIDRLVKTTRQRQSFRRKIASSVAMQKLSSFGVAGCSVIVPLMQLASNPEDLIQAWEHPFGGKILLAGGLCVVGGLTWMLSMTRAKL